MKLTILIGIPGSGKTYYAKRLKKPSLSLDAIRKEIYGDERVLGKASETDRIFRERLESLAARHRDVVLDATHVSRRRREKMIRLGRRLGYERIVGVWFQTPIAICLQRNRKRRNPLPDFVLFKMRKDLERQPPSLDEGFDALEIIAPA